MRWLWRSNRESDLEEELRFHLEEEAGNLRERGMPSDAARLAARRELGNVGLLKEDTRAIWTWMFWEHLKQDLRSGIRLLRAHPGFTAVAVISLAVGIGANTAMFSVADAILLHPLPVGQPSEIVRLMSVSPGDESGGVSYLDLLDLSRQTRSLAGITGYAHALIGFRAGSSGAAQVKLAAMTATNFFDVLGVRLLVGRGFRAGEDRQPVCVLGYDLWRSAFAGDPSVAGQTIRLSNLDVTVVGVVPQSFGGLEQFVREQVYVPIGMWPRFADEVRAGLERRDHRMVAAYGRLRPGVTSREAQSEMAAIAANLARAYPEANRGRTVAVMTERAARERNDPTLAPLAILLIVIASLVLLIACANVANLLLSRAGARSREIAVRLAIGASKGRLMRQLLTESLLLATLGGIAGLALALAFLSYLSSIRLPSDLPIGFSLTLDERLLTVSLAATLLSGLVFGLAPAWQMVRTDLNGSLKSGEVPVVQRGPRFAARHLLVTGQVAVSTLLLVLGGLFVKDFITALRLRPGFRTDHILLVGLNPGAVRYTEAQGREFYRQVVTKAKTLPGVRSVALAANVPLGYSHSDRVVTIDGYELPRDQQGFLTFYNTVDQSFFPTMQIPLVAGRNFDEHDRPDSPLVAIVNETMAQKFWPKRSAVGGRIQYEGKTLQVVGIVKNMKYNDISETPMPYFFVPFAQQYTAPMTLLVETSGDPSAQTAPVMAAVRGLDPEQPIQDVNTMDRFFRYGALFGDRLIAQIVTGIGVFGSLLAVIGLYGVIAYAVNRRTREIGIRVAVGADSADVLGLFLGQGVRFTLVGVAIGLVLAVVLSPFIGSQLVDGNPRDPLVLAVVPVLLSAVSLLACYVPARRATAVDPLRALRQD
jgi:predicted permease